MRFSIWIVVWVFVSLPQAIAQDEVGECEFDNSSASSATGSEDVVSGTKSLTSASPSPLQLGASAASSTPSSGSTSAAGISSALSISSAHSDSASSLSSFSGTSAAGTPSDLSIPSVKSTLMTSVLSSSSTPAASTPSALSISSVNSTPMSNGLSTSSTSSARSISSVSSTLTSSTSSLSSTSAASTPSALIVSHPLSDCPTGVGYDPTPGILAIGYPARSQNIPVSQPFNITWTDLSDITNVAIVLCHGPPTDCVSLDCIIPSIENTGSYFWTPRSTLEAEDGQGYGIKIIAIGGSHDGEFQFSPQFGISNSSVQSSHPR